MYQQLCPRKTSAIGRCERDFKPQNFVRRLNGRHLYALNIQEIANDSLKLLLAESECNHKISCYKKGISQAKKWEVFPVVRTESGFILTTDKAASNE